MIGRLYAPSSALLEAAGIFRGPETAGRMRRGGPPGAGQQCGFLPGYVVFAGLVSGMGTTVFAAHSIAVTAETIFYVPGYGLRSAASTLIGTARGEGDVEKMKMTGALSVLLTVGIMCCSGVILFFGSRFLMSLFTPSGGGGQPGRADAPPGGAVRALFRPDGDPGGYLLRTGPDPLCLSGGDSRDVGRQDPVTFLCVRVWGLGCRRYGTV